MTDARNAVLWVLTVALAVTGVLASIGVLTSVDTTTAAKAVTAQCETAGAVGACLDAVGRLKRLKAGTWLAAAGVSLAGIGSALGFTLLLSGMSAVATGNGRSDRGRPPLLAVGAIVIALAWATLLGALLLVTRTP